MSNKYQINIEYSWLLEKLDSNDINEGLILFIYDWCLSGNDITDSKLVTIENIISQYFKILKLKDKLNVDNIGFVYWWVFNNLMEIENYLCIYPTVGLPDNFQELAFMWLEEIILEYIDWKERGRDFSKLWILVRQKYNYMYNKNYEKGKYEIIDWDKFKLIEIID